LNTHLPKQEIDTIAIVIPAFEARYSLAQDLASNVARAVGESRAG
jgi:hypothetical protein